MIDEKLFFREHLDSACIKASKTVSNLSRIMANCMEPRTRKRRVLLEVAHSVLLYGAEIWADILKHKTYRRKKHQCKGEELYRTVSEAAVLLIAEATPIDLLAFERVKHYDAIIYGDSSNKTRSRIKKKRYKSGKIGGRQERWADGRRA
ncbi:uncharacterized protein LOC113375706 [Ctenocephalides felis]|uniref:uncharacterized protein LOC113375706 n=1 Tax=Ctenocephalides felis TaxID=7515 RepID=UPI000E6E1525|nr:uncharacterized protein LOC113375706 [Ctenocephalides felis]